MTNSACDLLLYRTYEEIWIRGQKYADSNRVEIVTSNDKQVEASVVGTQKYTVNLRFTGGGISKKCNCPFAKDSLPRHSPCKHMVAVAILWDESRGITRPSKEEIEFYTIAPPAISGREIDEMFRQPLKADLEKLRILADETALGGRPRPHSRLPNMPSFNTGLGQPLTIPEIKSAFSEIASWSRRRSYDPYFCSGEMVAAFCEILSIIKMRLAATEPLITAEILLIAQKFHYRLIIDLIDDSNGLHEFTEAYLDDIYQTIKNTDLKNEQKGKITKLLKEFNAHRNDY